MGGWASRVGPASAPNGWAKAAAEAYLLFLLAIDGAHSSIYLTNPYFVPDNAMADALVRAAGRGVRVSVITAALPRECWMVSFAKPARRIFRAPSRRA